MSAPEESTEDAAAAAPRLLGERYELGGRLGRGSMGVVWSGYDQLLHRSVAVKEVRLPAGMPEDAIEALRERTLREARAIAALSHPNVITVYDVVQQEGSPFVVMELMSGRSLAELVRDRGRLDETQGAAVADAVAAGLDAAHRMGITHRDVKPGNVLIGEDDQIKLTDFGIARNASDKTMTQSGIVLGSPSYMAPEVAAGKPVTPAADLWSLGATLYCAAEGEPPYDVDGEAMATLTRVVHGEVPVPRFAGELQPVISALMHKDPAARMDLMEVRRSIYRLLPPPGKLVFPVTNPTAHVRPVEAPPTPEEPARESSAPLAADPGPLPFDKPTPALIRPSIESLLQRPPAAATNQRAALPDSNRDDAATAAVLAPVAPPPGGEPVRQPAPSALPERDWAPADEVTYRRGALARTVLALFSLLVFLLAAAGGFALARTLAGEPLRPERELSTAGVGFFEPLRPFASRQGQATTLSGAQGGNFTVAVPANWQKFTEQRSYRDLPAGTVVHYVSPDGAVEVTVERIEAFYPGHTIGQYRQAVRASSAAATFETPTGPRQLMYRTYETASGSDAETSASLGRTTYLRTVRADADLWVIGATVPTKQEDAGRTEVFLKAARSFRPLD